ncbi:MAG: hypothetical protein GY696_06405, partial [Gammaproteobacteria bacterium]|nr:hypothetical protein [Gammaproteobacteria bacterium]
MSRTPAKVQPISNENLMEQEPVKSDPEDTKDDLPGETSGPAGGDPKTHSDSAQPDGTEPESLVLTPTLGVGFEEQAERLRFEKKLAGLTGSDPERWPRFKHETAWDILDEDPEGFKEIRKMEASMDKYEKILLECRSHQAASPLSFAFGADLERDP